MFEKLHSCQAGSYLATSTGASYRAGHPLHSMPLVPLTGPSQTRYMVDFLRQGLEKVLLRRLGWWSAIIAQLFRGSQSSKWLAKVVRN